MKYTATLLLFLFISFQSFSQDEKTKGLFYKFSLATTLTLNEDFEFGTDQTLINPSAFFLNNTVGIQFDHKSSVGFNVEYDWHSRQGLNFLPVYFSYRYNVFEYENNLFLRVGYGRLVDLGKAFQRGTFYKVGFGFQFFDEDYKNSVLLGLDFSRKRFGFLQSEKIASVSVYLEFMVF
jgi:hypothetical protein